MAENSQFNDLTGRRHFDGPRGQADLPYLLTGHGVTTARRTKLAQLADIDPAGQDMQQMLVRARQQLAEASGAGDAHSVIITAGSAQHALEAAVCSFVPPRRKKSLVLATGLAAEALARLLECHGRQVERVEALGPSAAMADTLAAALDSDSDVAHVWLVHCDFASGRVQPLSDIARVVQSRGRTLLVDASLTFGGTDIDLSRDGVDVLVSAVDQCLESVAGLGLVIARRSLLEQAEGKVQVTSADLHGLWQQHEHGEANLPPGAIAALIQAMDALQMEGGKRGRAARYRSIAGAVLTRLQAIGFVPFLPAHDAGPILQVFRNPKDPQFLPSEFASRLLSKGFAIRVGAESFAIGTTGHIDEDVIKQLAQAVIDVIADMNLRSLVPHVERQR